MEIYRTINGPFPGCPSYGVLQRLYQSALPKLKLDIADCSLEQLTERDSKMFFPKSAIYTVLDKETVETVLGCTKECCKARAERSKTEFPTLVNWVMNDARTLLAILIYLGHTQWINTFKANQLNNNNLDRLITFVANHKPSGLSSGFSRSYERTLDLFRPPVFVMGQPIFTYEDNQRFPYINDEYKAKGSFAEVRKFLIHPDYLDGSVKEIFAKKIYSSPSPIVGNTAVSPVFARKILKYSRDKSEFDMEIQVLRIIDNEKHNNIIDVIAFYCWRGELNCVFPFVEFNLYEVLHKNWKPQSIVHLPRSLRHWLWQQMHRVADALAAIHNPRKQERRTDGRKIIAFHFDLKPQNILVTPDGTLKITDFGQSMVKMVQENESEYGTYVGGDPAYGPPEVLGRDEIDMLRSMVFPTNLTASQQLSNPVPSPPPSSAGSQTNASDFRRPSAPSLVRSTQSSIRDPVGDIEQESRRDSYSYVSSISAPSSTSLDHHPSIATANYDVWSLACIMVEVLVFIFNEESAGIPEFEDARRNEEPDGRGLCFHKGTRGNSSLKKCVRATLDKLKDPLDAAATPGQPPSYLDDVVRLIDSMFIIDPKKRHSSDRVIWEFNKLADIHKDDNDPNANIARIMRSLGPVEGFNELGYKPDKKSGDIVPFYNMSNIKLEINPLTIPECRIQLFRQPGAVFIRIRYNEGLANDSSHPFSTRDSFYYTRDSFYYPIYLFDTSRPLACLLKEGKRAQTTLHFGSDDDLLAFQTAIMRHEPIRGINVSKARLRPTKEDDIIYADLFNANHRWARCQIWMAQAPQYVAPMRNVSGSLNPLTQPKSTSALFFSCKEFFGVPLQDGKKAIREKNDPILNEITRITIGTLDASNKYFHYVRPKGDETGAPAHFDPDRRNYYPAIPLTEGWLEENNSRKADAVDIRFPSNTDLLEFQQEIQRANIGVYRAHIIPWRRA